MATKIDKEACRAAYNLVRDDGSAVIWVTFRYDGCTIVPGEQGAEYERFVQQCTDDVRLFAFVRFTTGDAMSKRSKFALITWIGENVSGLQRAKTGTDKTLVKEVVQVLLLGSSGGWEGTAPRRPPPSRTERPRAAPVLCLWAQSRRWGQVTVFAVLSSRPGNSRRPPRSAAGAGGSHRRGPGDACDLAAPWTAPRGDPRRPCEDVREPLGSAASPGRGSFWLWWRGMP
uniref:Coactosin-like protein n=1 Tax=Oryctolagus cuniculus TaxID=9986 RepID=A0A5F9DL18_RABIT